MKFLTAAECTDAERDALAVLRVLTADELDEGAARVLEGAVTLQAAISGMAFLLLDELAAHGINPAEWIARKQAGLLAAEAGTESRPGPLCRLPMGPGRVLS